jgi:hypothetical protein
MSLKYGVPISSQWQKRGHIYPIQVAQYGLSHFSKFVNNNVSPRRFDRFLIDESNHFVYNENADAQLKPTHTGFEFKFPSKLCLF